MKREIKFRGIDIKTKKFVYGSLVDFSELNDCPQYEIYSVDKTTKQQKYYKVVGIGQYTGLKDKNNKEIYEGDILETWYKEYPEYNKQYKGDLVTVKYNYGGFLLHFLLDWCGMSNNIEDLQNITNYKVIGNIYENPELLKSK